MRSTLAGTFKHLNRRDCCREKKKKREKYYSRSPKYRRQESARKRGHNNKRAKMKSKANKPTNQREIESKQQAVHRSAWPSIYYTIVACIIIRRKRCVWRMEHKGLRISIKCVAQHSGVCFMQVGLPVLLHMRVCLHGKEQTLVQRERESNSNLSFFYFLVLLYLF
jgi:hypothetical protein